MSQGQAIGQKLEQARRDLLDLTARNRLLNTPLASRRSSRLDIVDERSLDVFQRLVGERKSMGFASRPDGEANGDAASQHPVVSLAQPEEEAAGSVAAERHRDDLLQTRLTSEALQKRLLALYYDARTYEEEQGVNILYLALGFLKWHEADGSDRERFAPLVLVPVELSRASVQSRFRVKWTEEEIATNLSLQTRLKSDFGLDLPDVPETEELSPDDYFAQVRAAIAGYPQWEVRDDAMVLWFFSFSKFLMYRDLQPDKWPEDRSLAENRLVVGLLGEGFQNTPPVIPETESIDRHLRPLDMIHVVDADSSQSVAIEEVRRGRDLVVQGPPGTGKSQTITNLIATAVKDGKTVLFVSEKMAALEVVQRRLAEIGLGPMCLELHSHMARKAAVLAELENGLKLARPKEADVERQAAELEQARDTLNRHAELLHTPLDPAHVTPYQALGALVQLRARGVPPAEHRLADSVSWTRSSVRGKEALLAEVSVHLERIGTPCEHPWRGVRLDAILPTDLERLTGSVPELTARIERLAGAAHALRERVPLGGASNLIEVSRLAQLAARLLAAPDMDRAAVADPAWERDRRGAAAALVARGKTLAACRAQLAGKIADAGWTTDVAAARRGLAAHGHSWFRLLKPPYREAMAVLRGIMAVPPPKSPDERISLLDTLIQGQNALAQLQQDDELGRQLFGSRWRGADSDWEKLETVLAWIARCESDGLPAGFREVLARLDTAAVGAGLNELRELLKPLHQQVEQLCDQFNLDLVMAFGSGTAQQVPLDALVDRLRAWRAEPESLSRWIAYHHQWRQLPHEGMAELAEHVHQGRIAPGCVLDRFHMAYHEELMREAFRRFPTLAAFDGASHEQVLERFRQLDQQRQMLARLEVASAHWRRIPTGGEAGEIGIVRREIRKKRRHMPLRRLLREAGRAVQAIKPVFMMSPISIAQFLEPGALEFDLMVIDEASQVRPVDALGAIARARQVVVVGDDKQLPPTSFFDRMLGEADPEDEEAETFQAADVESILDLCAAQNLPQRMLQWHYRSRHHSLITVSNHEFYDDRLFVVPSPHRVHPEFGLSFRHVADGTFDRGRSRTNRTEAQAVADAVMDHARRHADLTLGVGTFSLAQQTAILDEVELRRREHPELESFFGSSGPEPFFVKNLENIQGDERDVIFISVGYGPDDSGYMAMNFGPLSREGGQRRLNVLISRAKQRCVVFSSIRADDIDLNRARSRGVKALKTFLRYAEHGCLDVGVPTDRDHDSQFEHQVAEALQQHGFRMEPQVGAAGFYIDLAVVDPDRPGRYVLGIECDGAAYHSCRSARDRDRLRQQVLENRGWIIHRIWSTDWFHRPDDELRKAVDAIERARAEWARRDQRVRSDPSRAGARLAPAPAARGEQPAGHEAAPPGQPVAPPGTASSEPSGDGRALRAAAEGAASPPDPRPPMELAAEVDEPWSYREADPDVAGLPELARLSIRQLAPLVGQVVAVEGPIHLDELIRRIARCFDRRASGRLRDAVEQAVGRAKEAGLVVQDDLFLSPPGGVLRIRNREHVASVTLRQPDMLPPAELRLAIVTFVDQHVGASPEDTATGVARYLGFRSTGPQIRAVIEQQIEHLLQGESLLLRDGKLYAADNAVPRARSPAGRA